ncbi:MAG: chorismate synthase [Lachnospirales bacterium]
MNTIGHKLKLSVFGESHGPNVGATIAGLPPGIKIDMDFIENEIDKRRAKSSISTPRRETDKPKFISGIFNEYTTGMPVTVIFENKDARSKDYSKIKDIPRPSHGDYPAHIKYKGFEDYRGGGHFSGRNTTGIVALGAICKLALKEKNIDVVTHIKSIGDIEDKSLLDVEINNDIIEKLDSDFPVLNDVIKDKMIDEIELSRNVQDSIGGQVEIAILNVPIGVGDPYFERLNSYLAQLAFSLQGVKAMEVGVGFKSSKMVGSQYNDQMEIRDGKVHFLTNNAGGINGGLSNGMPIIINTAIRPTASIGKAQKSINMKTMENAETFIGGRHDPCIVHRASHGLNALISFGILDMLQ